MAKKNIPKTNKTPTPVKPTGIDFYFGKYAGAHQNPVNKFIQMVFIPLMLFGVFGLVWMIPFPYIKFLGQYNQDFNWSSFLLAFLVYYYIRFSPALAYVMLFVMLLYFYIITQMVLWQHTGGPDMWLVCSVIFLFSCLALYAGYKGEGKKLSIEYRYKNILIAPLYLVQLIFKRFRIKY